jgi:alpha-N-arabinofuranosidase
MSYEGPLLVHAPSSDSAKATLSIDASRKSPHAIPPYLYGKFCEHLGTNIYNGMDAQTLRNPTFAKWNFGSGENLINGGVQTEIDSNKISQYAERWTRSLGLPQAASLFESYKDTIAFHWSRLGDKETVRYSGDVGPHGGRAQRIEVLKTSPNETGIAQYFHLPVHRTRDYQFRIVVRAQTPVNATLVLSDGTSLKNLAQSPLSISREWKTFNGTLSIAASENLPECFRLALTVSEPANIVLARVLVYPNDHVNGSDPDVIKMLKESKLPLLRWPGGNFVSGYRWRDGVGPVDQRPTVPNPAWDGLEYNFFGTDEFMSFCKAVGCDPLICVNAGDGTPEEAAAWIEYCNGSNSTPMGRLRAQNGHPEPYNIRLWEVGNELSGPWQVSWTYSGGNADRYQRFSAAMLKADPTIQLLGCGGIGDQNGEWNHRLIDDCAGGLRSITDHILNGCDVNSQTDPVELHHAYMGHSVHLGRSYSKLRQRMLDAGIKRPRLAVTECQLFAHFRGEVKPDGKLSPQTTFHPATISEAVYMTTLVHECIRLGDFVELFTHSATVNHGGGLRKHKERVFANPVHHAHAMGAALLGATPVAVELSSGVYATKNKFSSIPPLENVPNVDVMAALSRKGDALVVMLAHRSATSGPIQLSLGVKNFAAASEAEVLTLADEVPYGANTHTEPDRIKPKQSTVRVQDGKVTLTLPPYSVTRVIIRS